MADDDCTAHECNDIANYPRFAEMTQQTRHNKFVSLIWGFCVNIKFDIATILFVAAKDKKTSAAAAAMTLCDYSSPARHSSSALSNNQRRFSSRIS
jgi:hypothetical protein